MVSLVLVEVLNHPIITTPGGSNGGQSTTTTTTATTTTTSSQTATATPYIVITKPGTTLSTFHNLVASLAADAESSREITYPTLDWQVYVSPLSAAQIKLAEAHHAVHMVHEDIYFKDYADDDDRTPVTSIQVRRDVPGTSNKMQLLESHSDGNDLRQANRIDKRALAQQQPSPGHLRLLSRPTTGVDGDYIYDFDAKGEGVTIYDIDQGINWDHRVRIFFKSFVMRHKTGSRSWALFLS